MLYLVHRLFSRVVNAMMFMYCFMTLRHYDYVCKLHYVYVSCTHSYAYMVLYAYIYINTPKRAVPVHVQWSRRVRVWRSGACSPTWVCFFVRVQCYMARVQFLGPFLGCGEGVEEEMHAGTALSRGTDGRDVEGLGAVDVFEVNAFLHVWPLYRKPVPHSIC